MGDRGASAAGTIRTLVEFKVFGGLVADRGGTVVELGGRKQRSVLAALLLELGRPVSASRLEQHVWGDEPPANPETSLQAYISNLRRALEPDRKPREPARLLVTQPAGYAVLVPAEQVDAARFELLARHGLDALRRGDASQAASHLEGALALWTGPVLPELAGHAIVDESANRFDGLRAQVLEHRFEAGLELGEHDALLPRIEAAVAEHPYRERLRAQLAVALYGSGRQRDALASLDDARRVLVDVGLAPGTELRHLEARILEQDPALDLVSTARRVPAVADAVPAPPERPPSAPAVAERSGSASGGSPFVGRDRDLAALLEAAAAAASGIGRAVVISGEPGIGKTRLVEELTARLPDTTVAWGRCPESGAAAAYWPCIQIGRQLEGADAIDGELVSALLPSSPPVVDSVPVPERFSLHATIVDLLASSQRPLVLVVDDLQWADPASLRVIEFVAAELRRLPVLLVVTVRPVTSEANQALVDCLGELARSPGSVRLELAGLTAADVAEWLSLRSGSVPAARSADLVRSRTGGNPFFVGEVLALLAGDGNLDGLDSARYGSGVPAAVQDVVRRRVSRLPAESQQLLAVASVVGRTFDVDVLAEVAGESPLDVLDRIDPALAAGLLSETDLPGRFAFSHAIVAETLEAEVAPGRRARLHAGVTHAIATLRAADLDSWLAELAHHAVEGMAAGIAGEAYEWSARAAAQATQQLAHEDAAGHWERAVRALELARPNDVRARYDALLEQGRAWLRVDDVFAGYQALGAAIDLAIALGEPDLAATAGAAMNVDGLWQSGEVALSSAGAVAALERALEVMGPAPTPERAIVLGCLAENAYWLWPTDRLDDISAQSVAVARQLGDPVVLGRALHKRNQTLWRASTLELRGEAAFELLDLIGHQTTTPAVEAMGLFGAAGVQWERGDALAAADLVAQARPIAARLSSPALDTQLDYFQAALDAFFGNLDAAEENADRAHEVYRRTRRWIADAIHAGNLLTTLVEQDRTDELDAAGQQLMATDYRPFFQEGYALALVWQGRLDEAERVVQGQLPPLIDTWMTVGVLAGAACTRAALGDLEGTKTLRDQLLPYQGRLATVGTGPAFGDVHGALSEIARAGGDVDEAVRHADASVAVLTHAGSGPLLTRALLRRAELRPETAAADREAAARLIERFDLRLLRRQLAAR